MQRTQFDPQLLPQSISAAPLFCRNHGRHLLVQSDGTTYTALAWGGPQPVVRLWRNHQLIAEHSLSDQPSAPCLVAQDGAAPALWLSVGAAVCCAATVAAPPRPVAGLEGVLQDLLPGLGGATILALTREKTLLLVVLRPGGKIVEQVIDTPGDQACLDSDQDGALHLVYRKNWAIEYRRFTAAALAAADRPSFSQRLAEPFGSHPVVLAWGKKTIVSYLGESLLPDSADQANWAGKPWRRRIGLGGYVAALVLDSQACMRCTLVDSQTLAKPLWPKKGRFQYDYPNVAVHADLEQFGPPALGLGPDGVPQVLWSCPTRRWVYAARFLGAGFARAGEVRGPFEQLAGECLAPRRTPAPAANNWPIVITTASRCYQDALVLPPATVAAGRRMDFLQFDELCHCENLELAVNPLQRAPENPLIRSGGSGSFDEAGLVGAVFRNAGGWHAQIVSKIAGGGWKEETTAHSQDGKHWVRGGPQPAGATYRVDGQEFSATRRGVFFLEDAQERDPARRFKGLWGSEPGCAWGVMTPVFSGDAKQWFTVRDPITQIVSDGAFLWIDEHDVSQRRYKAIGNARSVCGRVCAQWTSPDGLHWQDVRDSLDVADPFGSPSYWSEGYQAAPGAAQPPGTGRILVDPWAGPDDEDEIHGGRVFHEGQRWLLHYMKWTPDGHIIPALACSRDGLNFTRVAGGAITLPLGEPGTWDSGRISLENQPYLVGDTWYQHYVGSGWKHGMWGVGAAPHRTSNNVGIYSPNQIGLAYMPQGHWAHLQRTRQGAYGQLVTVALTLQQRHHLTLDVAGLAGGGAWLACAVLQPEDDTPLPGFAFDCCDPIGGDGSRQAVRWAGKGLDSLGSRTIKVAVRLDGLRLRLFGLNLHPAGA